MVSPEKRKIKKYQLIRAIKMEKRIFRNFFLVIPKVQKDTKINFQVFLKVQKESIRSFRVSRKVLKESSCDDRALSGVTKLHIISKGIEVFGRGMEHYK